MVGKYIPERGDIAWLTLDPKLGHEQKGRRPVLIVSDRYYNSKSELCLACPITSMAKGYAFEVSIHNLKVTGTVLADQITSFAWKERQIKYIGRANSEVLREVCKKASVLIREEL